MTVAEQNATKIIFGGSSAFSARLPPLKSSRLGQVSARRIAPLASRLLRL